MRGRKLLALLPVILFLALPGKAHAQFTFSTNNDALTITRYSGTATLLEIPAATNGYPITGIGAGAFMRCSSLTNVVLPESIVTIGDSAFVSCFGLTAINFPGKLASIGATVFNGCKLTRVILPQSVTNIGSRAFSGCSTLEQITVDGGNAYYCDLDGVLFNRSQTTLIQCPARRSGSYAVTNTVIFIAASAFTGSALEGIDLPAGVLDLGGSAFSNATNLTNIAIPETVTNIAATAFAGCSSVRSVSIPEGVTSIATYTFFHCTGLTNLDIGRGVTSIGVSAFYGCTGLTRLAIPDNVTNLDWQAFIDCSGLRNVWVGKGVASIGDSAFLGCVDLAGIYFTGNAPSVGMSIFGYSSVTVYYLPQTTGWGPTLGGWPAKLWNPTVQTDAPDFGIRTNCFGFTISGTANIPVVIDACTNPGSGLWTALQSCTLTNGSIYFSDADWTNYPTRFYRIRSP